MYCNCFSTTGLSFTIVSFSGGQNTAWLRLWKAILFSSTTLFILLILHLHIHDELCNIPVPKPSSKAAVISVWIKPWPPCCPTKLLGTTNPTSTGSGAANPASPERAQGSGRFSLPTRKKQLQRRTSWFRANLSKQFSEKIPVLLVVRELPCCSHPGYMKLPSHIVDWTPFFPTHLHGTSAAIATQTAGKNKKQTKKTQQNIKTSSLL